MIYRINNLKLKSRLNERVHWSVRAKDAKAERYLGFFHVKPHTLPCVVTITRIAPRMLDDDNLAGSAKSLRDGIADRLGIDDRNTRVQWRYAQRKGEPKEYAVEVQITSVQTDER